MERGGVDGNVDYKRAPKFAPGPSKKKFDGMSALEKVKADIRAKHGKGAIMDTKKMKRFSMKIGKKSIVKIKLMV